MPIGRFYCRFSFPGSKQIENSVHGLPPPEEKGGKEKKVWEEEKKTHEKVGSAGVAGPTFFSEAPGGEGRRQRAEMGTFNPHPKPDRKAR